MDELRKLFAKTRDAKSRGYGAGRFSFNSKVGWCPNCQGYGLQRIEMQFLQDLFTKCPECKGRRYNRSTLQVRYRGHSIADILAMPISEARSFFENVDVISRPLQTLEDVGVGYLSLGQPSTSLSGGEAQRIKLATELARGKVGLHNLYILDEPTTGLHFRDVQRLLSVLDQLVRAGNSVILIEHHMDVIANSDWVIDLGPGAGEDGGCVVAVGPPDKIRGNAASKTGLYLKRQSISQSTSG